MFVECGDRYFSIRLKNDNKPVELLFWLGISEMDSSSPLHKANNSLKQFLAVGI